MRPAIRILSEDVSNKIAAGEVIERPASIVKELVENAIDAGASRISVEVKGAGKELIRVVDDGAGVPADEAHLAFLRHATSKIHEARDLVAITTLGFRGEALPSIASVSRVEFLTRTKDADEGVRLEVRGQEIRSTVCGAPVGTQVTVTDLFYNTPARYKFLKSDTAERRYIADFLTAAALAHPQIAFRLTIEGRQVLSTAGSGNLKEAIAAVYGRSVLTGLLSVEWPAPWGGLYGYVGKPVLAKGNRSMETLFVNGRWVQNRMLFAAVEKGYEALLAHRRFPLAVLHIEIDPTLIDVNVHPAKTEIRFRDENEVFRTVMKATRSALVKADLVTHIGVHSGMVETAAARAEEGDPGQTRLSWSSPAFRPKRMDAAPSLPVWAGEGRGEYVPAAASRGDLPAGADPVGGAHVEIVPGEQMEDERREDGYDTPGDSGSSHAGMPLSIHEAERAKGRLEGEALAHGFDPRELLATANVVGQLAATYLLVPVPFGLWLVDQHVAHERILYESVLAGDGREEVASQELLVPHTVTLTPSLAAAVIDHLDQLEALGFHVESFGGNDFLLRAVPAAVGRRPGAVLTQVLEDLAAVMVQLGPSQRERAAATIACRAAIKAGERLQPEVMQHLVRRLATVENPYACPHGRPIIVQLGLAEIERRFGRS